MTTAVPNLLFFDLAILVSLVFGFCVTSYLLPSRLRWLRLALAPGAGAGVSAIIFFCFRRPMFNIEVLMVVVAATLLWRHRKLFAGITISTQSAVLFAVLMPALVIAFQAALVHVNRMPHGSWDGWAIWNWEARLLYRAGTGWRAFLPAAFHGDYPLLAPSTTARFWRYMGGELPDVGAWLGVALAFCSTGVLALTLSELRSPVLGTLMAITLLGTPSYLHQSATQYADVPLSFFFLAALALIALYFERSSESGANRMLAAAGFFAGCAGWTKNEGVLFIIAVLIALVLPIFHQRRETLRRLAAFGAGLAIPLLVIVYFKLTIHVSDYVTAYYPGKYQRILMVDRHVMILKYLGAYIFSFGGWYLSPYLPLAAFILLMGIQRGIFTSIAWRTIVATLCILAAGYYYVYVTTPVELAVHITSSLDRLLVQLWPSLLLVAGMVCRGQLQNKISMDA